MSRKEPYKVIVWGPGYLGEACVKQMLQRPEFELVGVLAYSDHKNGKDIGELLDLGEVGVTVTTNQEEIFRMEADCVLHCGTNMMDDTPRNKEVTRLLESGKNVVAAPSYHYPSHRGYEFVEMLETACEKGGAAVHGTGINPGFYCERLAVTLTGMCNKIEHIRCQEYFDLTKCEAVSILKSCCFGLTLEKAGKIIDRIEYGANVYYHAAVVQAIEKMGHTADRVDTSSKFTVADEDLYLPASDVTIKKGEVSCWEYSITGIVDGKPFFTLDEIFYLDKYAPVEGVGGGEHYKVAIEGKPTSVSMEMDLCASVEQGLQYLEGDNVTPGYYATAMTLIQAIPKVCSAKPGIVLPEIWAHYMDDYRKLA